jgi:RNA-directed DNA polymerase
LILWNVHDCRTKGKSEQVRNSISKRLAECKLVMHPGNTMIVYCKDGWQKENYPDVSFDFLGFTYQPRKAINRESNIFTGFLPAISNKAIKRIGNVVRSWNLRSWIGYDIEDLAGL